MSKNTSSSSSGIGFTGLLTVVFITLKLLGKIDWSWWWVLAPVWGSVALIITILVGSIVVLSIVEKLSDRKYKKMRKDLSKRLERK